MIVVVPAYQPDSSLANYVDELLTYGFRLVLIVNDGSSQDRDWLFEKLSLKNQVFVLTHPKNLGKGEALKTAFKYILAQHSGVRGVVTADSDGQHLAPDVYRVAQFLSGHPRSLCLGARNFSKNVPFRSWFGNVVTKYLFKILIGQHISDTQTGLRGIPTTYLNHFSSLPTSRYDYEFNMLIDACKSGVTVSEVPIQTVYQGKNKSSHFNPVRDSYLVYLTLFRSISLWFKRSERLNVPTTTPHTKQSK